jgi:hypothetical protein
VLARWSVTYGPEFAASKKACRASRGRLKLHLAAIELALERDPFTYSHAYTDEFHRLIQTDDFVDAGIEFSDGFILTAFIVVDPQRLACTINWIDMQPIPDEDLDDEDADDG